MQEFLIDLATDARSFLEPIWIEWHDAWEGDSPSIASRWTCGRSSLFVVNALGHEGIAATWKSGVPRDFEDGPDHGAFGFRANGKWESHAWVEAGGYIVDVTADQFGAPPVIVVSKGDERYIPGEMDRALPIHVANRKNAVAAIWPRWLDYRGKTARASVA